MSYQFLTDLNTFQQRVNTFLEQQLTNYDDYGSPLIKAMSYAVLLGGKRIRPFLIYTTGKMLGVPLVHLDHSAAAMEAIHAYSLVHDDLPAMDNDQLRRGQPTCHIAFDEATAILAGDSLQTFAFEVLSQDPYLSDLQKITQIRLLARSAGAQGMCIGQSLDLLAENKSISLTELEQIHRNKTGQLILASVLMGFQLSDYVNDEHIKLRLTEYANAIGLAFQVQDDILDVIGQKEKIGKAVGADENLNKSTYPKLLGLEQAKQKAQDLVETGIASLSELPFDTQSLKELAMFIIQREQ